MVWGVHHILTLHHPAFLGGWQQVFHWFVDERLMLVMWWLNATPNKRCRRHTENFEGAGLEASGVGVGVGVGVGGVGVGASNEAPSP